MFCQITVAAIYHVSPNGSDNGSGTASQPISLSAANNRLDPGDTALLHGGTYSTQIRPVNSGSSDIKRITYRAFGDGEVILNRFKGGAKESQGLIALGGRSYVTVSGQKPGGKSTDRFIKLSPEIHNGEKIELYGNFTGSTGCIVENFVTEIKTPEATPYIGWAFATHWYSKFYESKHNVLRNCEIHGDAKGYTYFDAGSGTNKEWFTEDTVALAKNAHHNLIENCYIGESKHVSVNMNSQATYSNVIRNNTIANRHHTAISIYGLESESKKGSVRNQYRHLIEDNTITASGETFNPLGKDGNAIQLGGKSVIIRHNIISEAGQHSSSTNTPKSSIAGIAISAGIEPKSSTIDHEIYHEVVDNRIYNNTITNNQTESIGSFLFKDKTGTFITAKDKGRNKFWNNFLYNNAIPEIDLIKYWPGLNDGLDRWVRNVIGRRGQSSTQKVIHIAGTGSYSLSKYTGSHFNPYNPEMTAWNGFHNQYDGALDSNSFVNYSGKNYHLIKNSPYVDTAAPLTQVSNFDSGIGTRLDVDDSLFFNGKYYYVFDEGGSSYLDFTSFPDWMGVKSDWVAIGPNPHDISTAKKVKIKFVVTLLKTHFLVLDKPITRNAGDYVWLWKNSTGRQVVLGKAPDVGAFEFSGSGSTGGGNTPQRYALKNKHHNKYLKVDNGNVGTRVTMGNFQNNNFYKWELEPELDTNGQLTGYVYLKNTGSGKYLQSNYNTNLSIQTNKNTSNDFQKFKREYPGNTYEHLRVKNTTVYLLGNNVNGVYGTQIYHGTNSNGTLNDDVKWELIPK